MRYPAFEFTNFFNTLLYFDSTVWNIRAYLITVLYNAPMTMDTAFGLDFRSTFGKPKGGTGYAP